MNKTWHPVL